MKTTFIGILLSIISYADGSNILVMLPLPTFSHTNTFMPIFTELSRRGHNVTVVSPFPQKEPVPNLKDIVLKNTMDEIARRVDMGNDNIRKFNLKTALFGIFALCETMLNTVLELQEFQAFLNDTNSKFDLVIAENFFCQQPLLAFGHKYGAPVVSIIPQTPTPSFDEIMGNPHPLAYVPLLTYPFSDHMTFLERVKNTLMSLREVLTEKLYGCPLMETTMKKHIAHYPGFENLPSLYEMQRNISLLLTSSHFSLSYPRPLLPNIVEIGGLSIKSGGKLPEDLDKYMNESKDGVILFTWGSHYKMTNMSPELLKAFMSVFSKLKQRVLMKWENETLPGKPDNVKIGRWFPQSSILGHQNIRLFISHGGVHGVTEAIYHGVPILGTPLFADQSFNLNMAKQAGMALIFDIDTVNKEQLFAAITKLINDPKYRKNAKKKSLIMKDRPLSALDTAVYWIEYVIRHKGAYHLRPGSLDLTWYQNMLLDVIAAIMAVLIALLTFFIFIIKIMFKMFSKKKHDNKGTKLKKSKKE